MSTAEEAFLSGRISAHEFPARRLETRDGRVHFARPFGINPHGIWDDSRPSGFSQEYEAWNEGYEAETTLCHLMGGEKAEGRH